MPDTPDPTPEARAREAAQVAAKLAAARVLYEAALEELGVEGGDFSTLPPDRQERFLVKAEALLQPQAKRITAQDFMPGGRLSDEPKSDTDAVSALAGGVRVEERAPDEEYVDEDGNWNPPFQFVVMRVQRGNMVLPLKVPVAYLAPDVASGAGNVIQFFKDAFMRTQQQGQATAPVQPNMNYALQLEDGTTLTPASRLRLSDFEMGRVEEEPTLPGVHATFIDTGAPARTEAPQHQPTGVGNPVVIEQGKVIGRPVAGGAQAAPQVPSQGEARLAPGQG